MEETINHESNLSAIKAQLERGWKLTVVSVLNSCHTIELRKYVSLLRKDGMDIKSEWVTKNGKHFKEYWLQADKAA